jgi:nucleoside-diphosphate-sugar epimerase
LTKEAERILITGSAGQIGSELTLALRDRYGAQNVVASDKHAPKTDALQESGPFEIVDVLDKERLEQVVVHYKIDTIYHMAAILSAAGEKHPQIAWEVNTGGLYNVLEIARERQMTRIFSPSSIAVFGSETPHDCAPQETILLPRTIYGVSKVAGELLGNYYVRHFGLDVRGLRYPGIISSATLPGGGTTDYAVAIFYHAVKEKSYTCFVREDTVLPMMYMPDCIKASIDLMEADPAHLIHHCDFNLAGMRFSVGELAAEIKKHIPEFTCHYAPDTRQEIADTWPQTIDDRAAREEWGWEPSYDLASMTTDMLTRLDERQRQGNLY